MNFQKKREMLADILEVLYLILSALSILYLFLGKTAFDIPWNKIVQSESGKSKLWAQLFIVSPYYLLGIIVFLRYLIQKKYNWKMIVLAGFLLYCGRYIWKTGGYSNVLLLTLMILGAYHISYQKMIRWYFLLISGFLLLAIACSLMGFIENYTYVLERGVRMSFGMNYPTNFASFVLFQILCWWYLRKEKLTYFEAGIVAGIAVLLKIFCDARTAYISLIGVALVMFWQRLQYQRMKRTNEVYDMNKIWSAVLSLVHPLAALGITILTVLYSPQSKLLNTLNNLFSSRLQLGKKALDVYGVQMVGKFIDQFAHTEGTSGIYFFIDSSYLRMSVMYGLAMTGLLLLAFLIISIRARTEKDWVFLWILVFAALHSIIEPHLLELQYCPFILAVFADTRLCSGMKVKEIFGRKNG